MPNIFTRNALNKIMEDGNLTPQQRTEQVYSLYGRALEDGYIGKGAARQAMEAAVEAALSEAKAGWEQEHVAVNAVDSDEYRALKGEFDAYRAMQGARSSADYRDVKPKFFETVYGMVDRAEGAKSVPEQLTAIRRDFEEYFAAPTGDPVPERPAPAVVLPTGGAPAPGAPLTLSEAMRRANAGEAVDIDLIGR